MATAPSRAGDNEPIVLRSERDGVVMLTLNRPKQLNALSEAMLDALTAALEAIGAEQRLRVVVLAGSGENFCAGHDLREMRERPDQNWYRALFGKCIALMRRMNEIPQPVIARVQGIATAAGCQLVAGADLAIASEDARFATSGINVGLFCSTPAVPLTRAVPAKPAFEMLVTGEFIDAAEAWRLGLVNRVVPREKLDAAVAELAGKILAKSPLAVATGKRLTYAIQGRDLDKAYAIAGETMARNMMAEDVGEGIDAFIAKRRPVWRGR
ncbi:MAG: enoyl-CoA hydratase [Rhodospirillales bacterium]|nr:enoyl-CoA hydratase [Rhodospirillales bacterium]